jgi:hypothetical protein
MIPGTGGRNWPLTGLRLGDCLLIDDTNPAASRLLAQAEQIGGYLLDLIVEQFGIGHAFWIVQAPVCGGQKAMYRICIGTSPSLSGLLSKSRGMRLGVMHQGQELAHGGRCGMGAGCDALQVARAEPEKFCGLAQIRQPNFGQEVAKPFTPERVFSILVDPLMCRHDRAPHFVHLTLEIDPDSYPNDSAVATDGALHFTSDRASVVRNSLGRFVAEIGFGR